MIHGIGTDIIEVERIEKAIKRWGKDFLKHVFTDKEMAYAKTRKFPMQHYAARFAAKEAVFKAIGNDPTITWLDIEILNDKFGKPVCQFKRKKFKNKIFVSLSHTKNYAVANAIVAS